MDLDVFLRNAVRILALLALGAFVGWVTVLNPLLLLAAISIAVAAYVLSRIDQARHPLESNVGTGRDRDDRVMEGSEQAISPGVSAGGIHLSFESRTRWRTRR